MTVDDRIEFRVCRLRKTYSCFWHLGRSVKLLIGNLCTLSVSTMDDVICLEPRGSIHFQSRQSLTLRPCLSSKQIFAVHLCHAILVCVNYWQSMHPEKAYEKHWNHVVGKYSQDSVWIEAPNSLERRTLWQDHPISESRWTRCCEGLTVEAPDATRHLFFWWPPIFHLLNNKEDKKVLRYKK